MKEKIREILHQVFCGFENPDSATPQILAEFKSILPEKQWTHPTSKGLKRNEFISFHRGESHNNCLDIINGRLE